MVAIRPRQADAFIANTDPSIRAILFFGPDAGLASERAGILARKLAERSNPPGEVIRLDDLDLEQDPERLAVELLTLPMFGGAKIVRVQAGRRVTAASLKPLLEGGNLAGALIVEAGNLRAEDSLRALFERAPGTAAVACYADEEADLERVITEVLTGENLAITPEAREHLAHRLGADRGLSRHEIEKLALYAQGRGTVTPEDVDAIVGDAAELAMDQIIDAAASGRADRALASCDRLISAGESPQGIIAAIQGHFGRLHRLRSAMDKGRSFDDVARTMRPPLFFKRRDAMRAQCQQWTGERLSAAVRRIRQAALRARRTGAVETIALERLLLEIAHLAKAAQRPGAARDR